MRKYTARMLFRDFREAYPELWCRGCYYVLSGFMQITISIPNEGKVVYEYFGNKLTWLEKWESPEEERIRKNKFRDNTYNYFLDELNRVMHERDLTQQDVANITGLSRKSINEYLGQKAIPKIGTMRLICNALDIDI